MADHRPQATSCLIIHPSNVPSGEHASAIELSPRAKKPGHFRIIHPPPPPTDAKFTAPIRTTCIRTKRGGRTNKRIAVLKGGGTPPRQSGTAQIPQSPLNFMRFLLSAAGHSFEINLDGPITPVKPVFYPRFRNARRGFSGARATLPNRSYPRRKFAISARGSATRAALNHFSRRASVSPVSSYINF